MPTRELAVQVREEVVKLSHGRKVHIVALYGGKPIRGQIEKLQRGADVVVGTPGRVLDHMGRGTLRLDDLKFVVLDEADRMLDIGFRPDIEKILRRCPASRQTLLLSATVPPPVERLAQRYMRDPEIAQFLAARQSSVETIEQFYFTVDPERKFDLLEKLRGARRAAAGDHLLPHQAGHRQGLPCGWRKSSPDVGLHSRRPAAERPRSGDGRNFARARSATWSRPTWSAAAST